MVILLYCSKDYSKQFWNWFEWVLIRIKDISFNDKILCCCSLLTMILLTLFKTCTYSLSQESLLYCYKCLIVTIVTPASQLISHLKFNWTHWSCTMYQTKIDHLQNEMTQVFLRELVWWWRKCMERFLLSKFQLEIFKFFCFFNWFSPCIIVIMTELTAKH